MRQSRRSLLREDLLFSFVFLLGLAGSLVLLRDNHSAPVRHRHFGQLQDGERVRLRERIPGCQIRSKALLARIRLGSGLFDNLCRVAQSVPQPAVFRHPEAALLRFHLIGTGGRLRLAGIEFKELWNERIGRLSMNSEQRVTQGEF